MLPLLLRHLVFFLFSLAFVSVGVSAWIQYAPTKVEKHILLCQRTCRAASFSCSRSSRLSVLSPHADEWVINPETGRLIKPNGPRWREFMHLTGGFISNDSKLIPIDKESLWDWENELHCKDGKSTLDVTKDLEHNTRWHPLHPVVDPSENHPTLDNSDKDERLPFLDQLLFVHKPSGLLTLPGIGEDKQLCLASLVHEWLFEADETLVLKKAQANAIRHKHTAKKKKSKKPKPPFVPRPCHRLDFDTSGVLVIALTREALRLTNAMFEAKESNNGYLLQKNYVALVAGHVVQNESTIDYP